MDTTTKAILFAVIFLGMSAGAVAMLFRFSVRAVLSTLSHDFPKQDVVEPAEVRSDERLAIGLMNMRVKLTRDAEHVHVEPQGWYVRFGAAPFSLPHGAFVVLGRRRADQIQLRLGRSAVWGPAWCFEPRPDETTSEEQDEQSQT